MHVNIISACVNMRHYWLMDTSLMQHICISLVPKNFMLRNLTNPTDKYTLNLIEHAIDCIRSILFQIADYPPILCMYSLRSKIDDFYLPT